MASTSVLSDGNPAAHMGELGEVGVLGQTEPQSQSQNAQDHTGETLSPRSKDDNILPSTGIPRLTQYLLFLHSQRIRLAPISTIDLKQHGKIRRGASMQVQFGNWNGSQVAIKRLNRTRFLGTSGMMRMGEDSYRIYVHMLEDLLYELKVMSHRTLRDHPNIVKLLAAGFESEERSLDVFQPFLVVELAHASRPDLLAYFEQEKDFTSTGTQQLFQFVVDIANGVSVLHEHNIIHG